MGMSSWDAWSHVDWIKILKEHQQQQQQQTNGNYNNYELFSSLLCVPSES